MVDEFGKYLLFKRIAAGGMAEIFLARQRGVAGFEKLVVVKRILPDLSAETEFVRMFLDEARLCASLSHPNVVQVYDLGEVGGSYFMAMEYVPGHDLASVLKRGVALERPMPPGIAARIVANACEGLHYAHTKRDTRGQPLQIVHRDVSPSNLLLSYDGSVKITDFGIAKAESQSVKTEAGKIKGKFSYMSPEQIRGIPLDGRSDVFSLGIVLHETLCSRRLFRRDNELAIMQDILEGEVRAPSELQPGVPRALDEICLKALHKDVKRRYQSAREFSVDLERFINSQPEPTLPQHVGEHLMSLFAAEHQAYVTALAELPTASPDQLASIFHDPSGPSKSGSAFSNPRAEAATSAVRRPGAKSPRIALMVTALALAAGVGTWRWLRAPVASGPTTGVIHVESEPPGARVWLDGAATDRVTPTSVPGLSFGLDHVVRLELEGHEAWESTVRLEPSLSSKALSTTLRAQPGSLAIVTEPEGATVLVDGRAVGASPQVVEGLGVSEHVVHVSKDGFVDAEQVVGVGAGQRVPVRLTLVAKAEPGAVPSLGRTRASVQVSLSSDPSTEVIYDGRLLGRTPVSARLPTGKASLTFVNKALDLSQTIQLEVPSGSDKFERHVAFGRGKLAADISPWADVYLGDKKLGTTPMAPRELYEGTYVLRLVNSELGAIKTLKVVVQPGKTTVVRESLE